MESFICPETGNYLTVTMSEKDVGRIIAVFDHLRNGKEIALETLTKPMGDLHQALVAFQERDNEPPELQEEPNLPRQPMPVAPFIIEDEEVEFDQVRRAMRRMRDDER